MKGILEQFTMTWRLILQDKGAMLLLFGAGLHVLIALWRRRGGDDSRRRAGLESGLRLQC